VYEGFSRYSVHGFEALLLTMILGPRFGHITSNITESFNASILDERELPPLQLMDALWLKYMEQRCSRHERAGRERSEANRIEALRIQSSQVLQSHGHVQNPDRGFNERSITPWAREHLWGDTAFFADCAKVQYNGDSTAKVEITGTTHIVDITKKTCTCKRWQDNLFPCGHGWAVIRRAGADLRGYKSNLWDVDNWRKTYDPARIIGVTLDDGTVIEREEVAIMKPIAIEHLAQPVGINIGVPPPKVQGMARKARGRKGQRFRAPMRPNQACSMCGIGGHNSKTCKRIT
jgi:hypothetical protein